MLLTNTKFYYNENGTYIQIQDLISCDVMHVNSQSRESSDRVGSFTNETIDSFQLNFKRGSNEFLDRLDPGAQFEIKYTDGAIGFVGLINLSQKINSRKADEEGNVYTNTFMSLSLIPGVIYKRVPLLEGAASGVQDVHVDGTSVVDPDTGIAEITLSNYAKQSTVEEIAGQFREVAEDLEANKQDKLTAGTNVVLDADNKISVSGMTVKSDENGIYIEE